MMTEPTDPRERLRRIAAAPTETTYLRCATCERHARVTLSCLCSLCRDEKRMQRSQDQFAAVLVAVAALMLMMMIGYQIGLKSAPTVRAERAAI